MIQTEYDFTLPVGYQDEEGSLHREGTMRLATAGDEILPLKDPRVQSNQAYLIVILLSRVITKLGSVSHINPKVIEGLYAADLRICRSSTTGSTRTAKPASPRPVLNVPIHSKLR